MFSFLQLLKKIGNHVFSKQSIEDLVLLRVRPLRNTFNLPNLSQISFLFLLRKRRGIDNRQMNPFFVDFSIRAG